MPTINTDPLERAIAVLAEAIHYWQQEPIASPRKPHLRSGVIQSFEFTYELGLKAVRRVLMERAAVAERVTDLSFNDMLRMAADAGLMHEPLAWRHWRELRNKTSHAYDELQAQLIADEVPAFLEQVRDVLLRVRLQAKSD
jgi:nucleotidyltransferase substrate binding protein (TIGR01987 family)